ncbi:MAG: hypothetical protein ACJAS1_005967, partial [Oleiphilaceae bacterium]
MLTCVVNWRVFLLSKNRDGLRSPVQQIVSYFSIQGKNFRA